MPLTDLSNKVLKETFTNGLFPWIRAEVEYSKPVGLPQMMCLAQKAEVRELIRREANLYGYSRGKHLYNPTNYNKLNSGANANEGKAGVSTPMWIITLRSTAET